MTTTNPTLLAMPIAKNGTKNIIPATQATAGDGLLSQSTGFPPETALPLGAGGKAPTREDFNGAFNLLSDIAFYTQKGWTFEYDANQTYFKGCIVMDATDGKRYECINDVPAGTILPSADQDNDYWREYTPGGVPLGSILPYAANAATPPYSFLFCEGQAVSRTMYPDLFALIGTTYGAGDGSTTFNLPNLIGKYPQGDTTAGTTKAAGLPNITGDLGSQRIFNASQSGTSATGAFKESIGSYLSNDVLIGSGAPVVYGFDASRSSAIYGNSTTVTPPTLTFRWIIKAYDAPTPSSAQIDLSQYASDLAKRLTREQTPAFNRRDVVTVSGTYTAPVTGWYKITVKGGGGGGQGGGRNTSYSYHYGGAGGGEGGTTIAYEKLTAGQAVSVVVGAGGAGGAGGETGAEGNSGGASSVTVNNQIYSANGGKLGGGRIGGSGGTGTIAGEDGTSTYGVFYHPSTNQEQYTAFGSKGGGYGGRSWYTQPNNNAVANTGGGGGGGGVYNATAYAGGNGASGFVEFEYFDPTLM